MEYCYLDGARLQDRAELHRAWKLLLCAPARYGDNLDALFDALTELRRPMCLILLQGGAARARFGAYADALFRTLREAAAENPCLTVQLRLPEERAARHEPSERPKDGKKEADS